MASLSDEPAEPDQPPAAPPVVEPSYPRRVSLTTSDVMGTEPAADAATGTEPPPLKLAPRSDNSQRQLARPDSNTTGAIGTVVGSLGVVLGLFVVIVWVSRRLGPAGSAPLPKEAVELLGRTTINGQHTLQLVRVGGRLLLVALSQQGAATLTEITNPGEVERLTAICLRQRPDSASTSFQETVRQLEREPASRSFVDQRRPAASSAARSQRTSTRA